MRVGTKQLHGVRPMFMLVNGFRFLAQQLDCQLLGIPHRQQAKYRWNDSSGYYLITMSFGKKMMR